MEPRAHRHAPPRPPGVERRTEGRAFDRRRFVTLMIALTGLGLPVSGIANHVHQLEPMSLSRHSWMAAHNALGALFVVFTLWHVVLNRRALARHLRGLLSKVGGVGRETLLASSILVAVMLAAVGHALLAHGG